MNDVVLIADNIRSTHNVGALFRTADCLGVSRLLLCGITPYPSGGAKESRMPYLATKITSQLHKTALGAEQTVPWSIHASTEEAIQQAKGEGYTVVALEQTKRSVPLEEFKVPTRLGLVVGPEVTGMNEDVLAACDGSVEIAMRGSKESLNVSVAAGIALYVLLTSKS